MKVTSEQLEEGLSGFYGTEGYYFNPFYREMKYTDGVKYFAETAGAYWLLDILGTEYHPLSKKHDFMNIELRVEPDCGARIVCENGNGRKVVADKFIEWTDCPEGVWQFFMEGGVLILPSEH